MFPGTNCAPDLANLYCYAIESKYIDTLPSDKAKLHANTRRFIDDILSFGRKPAPMELYHMTWRELRLSSLHDMKYKDNSISPTEVVFLGMRLTTNGEEIKIGYGQDRSLALRPDQTTKSNMPLHQGKGILKGLAIQWTMSNDLDLFKDHMRKNGQQRILNEILETNVTVTDSASQALDANTVQSTTVINSTDDIDVDDFEEESPHHPTPHIPEAEQATTTPKINEGRELDKNEPDTTTKEITRKKVNATNPIVFVRNDGWYQMEVIEAAIPMITQNKLQLSTHERTTQNQPFKHDCYLVITGRVGHYFTAMRCEDDSWQIRDNLRDNGNPIAIRKELKEFLKEQYGKQHAHTRISCRGFVHANTNDSFRPHVRLPQPKSYITVDGNIINDQILTHPAKRNPPSTTRQILDGNPTERRDPQPQPTN
eukprot:gene23664-1475_t